MLGECFLLRPTPFVVVSMSFPGLREALRPSFGDDVSRIPTSGIGEITVVARTHQTELSASRRVARPLGIAASLGGNDTKRPRKRNGQRRRPHDGRSRRRYRTCRCVLIERFRRARPRHSPCLPDRHGETRRRSVSRFARASGVRHRPSRVIRRRSREGARALCPRARAPTTP
jgi:hypothetical protein